MNDFAKVNKIYEKYFDEKNKPARVCVAVKELPKNSKIEIDCVAYLKETWLKCKNI